MPLILPHLARLQWPDSARFDSDCRNASHRNPEVRLCQPLGPTDQPRQPVALEAEASGGRSSSFAGQGSLELHLIILILPAPAHLIRSKARLGGLISSWCSSGSCRSRLSDSQGILSCPPSFIAVLSYGLASQLKLIKEFLSFQNTWSCYSCSPRHLPRWGLSECCFYRRGWQSSQLPLPRRLPTTSTLAGSQPTPTANSSDQSSASTGNGRFPRSVVMSATASSSTRLIRWATRTRRYTFTACS